MPMTTLFQIHLVGGYTAWLLCFGAYVLPWLKSLDRVQAHRAIAALHSFRFFGLLFVAPGVVGHLPQGFAAPAAYGDLATGVLAMIALAVVRVRPLFWLFVVAFNPGPPTCSSTTTTPSVSACRRRPGNWAPRTPSRFSMSRS